MLVFPAAFAAARDVVYVDAGKFPLYGKVSDSTSARYERLPVELKNVCRKPVWSLGRNSAGLFIRFRSNSTCIYAKWTSVFGNHMDHQTLIGTRGLDLYAIVDGNWRFVGSARPSLSGKESESRIVANMSPEEREYMLYLSLYDGVASLEIGIDREASIDLPAVDRPSREKPVVMYGTSILQGGCANRPGMAHTNIIGRRIDREVINLGFSGNALLDMEIARLMASVADPGLYVLDYVPNASAEMIDGHGEEFFRIIRDVHPDVPVIFVEDPVFDHAIVDQKVRREVTRKNAAQKALFERLRKAGEKHIYYIDSDGMTGHDGDGSVDGIHFTDFGMVRYVDHVMPTIKKALKKR